MKKALPKRITELLEEKKNYAEMLALNILKEVIELKMIKIEKKFINSSLSRDERYFLSAKYSTYSEILEYIKEIESETEND